MPKYAQLVIGPAGSGKSTYCHEMYEHCATIGRTTHVINLDPAAEEFKYPVSLDIRELVSLEDVMEELQLGPNGGLLYCMEYLEENLDDWLQEAMQEHMDDDYLFFDCPGQIELYSNVKVFKSFVDSLRNWGFNVCAVYLVDSQFMDDGTKFIAAAVHALSAMTLLELPHVNVLTKMDRLKNKPDITDFLDFDARRVAAELDTKMPRKFRALNRSLAGLVDEYSMVAFVPLDITDEESLNDVLMQVDHAIQYGEDLDVKTKDDDEYDEDGDEDGDFGEMDAQGYYGNDI